MIRSPIAIRFVASGTPTTAGIPYSRATTAPCDIIPPISITSALAVRKSGVQPGSVEGATSTSPGSRRAPAGARMTRATPRATPGDAGVPRIAPSAAGEVNAASASVPSDRSIAWDVTPPLLAAVLRPALGDELAHVFASQRAARVGEREEPDVIRPGDAAFGGKRHADRREDRSAFREHADRVELRCLARAGEGPDPAQEHAGEQAARTVNAGQQRGDRRLRLARTTRELRVRRQGSRLQALGTQPFGFAGGLRDVDTGPTRFGTRDYDAVTGRWAAKDMLKFGGGLTNLYSYGGEDPINLADPTGRYFAWLTPDMRAIIDRLELNPAIGLSVLMMDMDSRAMFTIAQVPESEVGDPSGAVTEGSRTHDGRMSCQHHVQLRSGASYNGGELRSTD